MLNEVDLVCPRCREANRPAISYIKLDPSGRFAECTVCSYSGLAADFIPKEK